MIPAAAYVGRFAPSPTGPLHFGSLATATASYLAARTAGGRWHLRIDDLDRAREVPGAADNILRTLTAVGFEWDGEVVRQSGRTEAYAAALDRLRVDGHLYACSCSRTDIESVAGTAAESRYPGTCRQGPRHPERALAVRFRTTPGAVSCNDALQGRVQQDVAAEVGDFVVRRRDGFFAYQLAVVVDDADLGVTHIVRGADLLLNTPRQILLQRALRLPEPACAHVPLAVDAVGAKLSKTTQAPGMGSLPAAAQLWQALNFLEQFPPPALQRAPVAELLAWALAHWSMVGLKGLRTKPAPGPPAPASPGDSS